MKLLKEIGLIGLGVMGKNIALNLSEKGVGIKGFNGSKNKLNEIKNDNDDKYNNCTVFCQNFDQITNYSIFEL